MAIATPNSRLLCLHFPLKDLRETPGSISIGLPSGFPIVVIKSVCIAASAPRAVRRISRPATRTTAREVEFT